MTMHGLSQRERFKRFLYKKPDSSCILWGGATATNGYGRFDEQQAHRVSWKLFICAEIPIGKMILHNCSNKLCVNPKHLYLGDAKSNNDFAWRNGECKLGKNHVLTHAQILEIRAIWKSAEIICFRRNRRSPTQQEIANRYGVSQAAISAILSGKNGKGICKGNTGFGGEQKCQSVG